MVVRHQPGKHNSAISFIGQVNIVIGFVVVGQVSSNNWDVSLELNHELGGS